MVNESVKIEHLKLVKLLQLAYSAEKAAAFAYIGHAGSVKNPDEKVAIKKIEMDEWEHRETVLSIMRQYAIPPSRYNEIKYHIIGRIISASCYVIVWFMPYYITGRWRDKYENGKAVDASGTLLRKHPFNGVVGFKASLVKENPRFARAFTAHLLRFVLARELVPADSITIVSKKAKDDFKLRSLIREVAFNNHPELRSIAPTSLQPGRK